MNVEKILQAYGLSTDQFSIEKITAGYINQTYKVVGDARAYVLQRVNKNIFRQPEVIAANIRHAADHLQRFHPEYKFLSTIKSQGGDEMVYDDEGYPWRSFPFIEHTVTYNHVSTEQQAYHAAKGFAALTRNLDGCDTSLFQPTIPRFHDLSLRYQQFEQSLQTVLKERVEEAQDDIQQCRKFSFLVECYDALVRENSLPVRILHNDTKINNILFDERTQQAVCVIDLDTLMPGYFIYDLGDMIRTFVSPVDEEERDLHAVCVRDEIYDALLKGYFSEMDDVLTASERKAVAFAGPMMTYIMALRMLADYLNGDVYYQTTYPKQNLFRARNQLRLLSELMKKNPSIG